MNKNTRRRVEAARDAYSRLKHNHRVPGDEVLAQTVGTKPRKSRKPSVGATGPDIAKRLGHDAKPNIIKCSRPS